MPTEGWLATTRMPAVHIPQMSTTGPLGAKAKHAAAAIRVGLVIDGGAVLRGGRGLGDELAALRAGPGIIPGSAGGASH